MSRMKICSRSRASTQGLQAAHQRERHRFKTQRCSNTSGKSQKALHWETSPIRSGKSGGGYQIKQQDPKLEAKHPLRWRQQVGVGTDKKAHRGHLWLLSFLYHPQPASRRTPHQWMLVHHQPGLQGDRHYRRLRGPQLTMGSWTYDSVHPEITTHHTETKDPTTLPGQDLRPTSSQTLTRHLRNDWLI